MVIDLLYYSYINNLRERVVGNDYVGRVQFHHLKLVQEESP